MPTSSSWQHSSQEKGGGSSWTTSRNSNSNWAQQARLLIKPDEVLTTHPRVGVGLIVCVILDYVLDAAFKAAGYDPVAKIENIVNGFLANPEPFLNGTRQLAEVATEGVVKPVVGGAVTLLTTLMVVVGVLACLGLFLGYKYGFPKAAHLKELLGLVKRY